MICNTSFRGFCMWEINFCHYFYDQRSGFYVMVNIDANIQDGHRHYKNSKKWMRFWIFNFAAAVEKAPVWFFNLEGPITWIKCQNLCGMSYVDQVLGRSWIITCRYRLPTNSSWWPYIYSSYLDVAVYNEDNREICVALDAKRLYLFHLPCAGMVIFGPYFYTEEDVFLSPLPNTICEFDHLAFLDAQSMYNYVLKWKIA